MWERSIGALDFLDNYMIESLKVDNSGGHEEICFYPS